MPRPEQPPTTSVKDKGGTGLPSCPSEPFLPHPGQQQGLWLSRSHLRSGPRTLSVELEVLLSQELALTTFQASANLLVTRVRHLPPTPASQQLWSPFESGPCFIRKASDPFSPPIHREPGLCLQLRRADPASEMRVSAMHPKQDQGQNPSPRDAPPASAGPAHCGQNGSHPIPGSGKEELKVSVYFRFGAQARL